MIKKYIIEIDVHSGRGELSRKEIEKEVISFCKDGHGFFTLKETSVKHEEGEKIFKVSTKIDGDSDE